MRQELKVMGILNVTEDSFSDGGQFLEPERALARLEIMLEEGADLIDLGAESTRPGASELDADVEMHRLIPLIRTIHRNHPTLPISVDTRKASVAAAALEAGAGVVNDVSALRHDPDMLPLLARHPDIPVILMHMQGKPQTMQENPHYDDLGKELLDFFRERIDLCLRHGIKHIILDPGIGFGKNLSHNLSILANLRAIKKLGFPVLLGASRKRFISEIDPSPTSERVGGSLAALAMALQAGLDYVRVHDIKASRQFIEIHKRISEEESWAF